MHQCEDCKKQTDDVFTINLVNVDVNPNDWKTVTLCRECLGNYSGKPWRYWFTEDLRHLDRLPPEPTPREFRDTDQRREHV